MKPRSVYIHVPFCRHRCGYCDFTLVAGRDELIETFLTAINRELDSITEPLEVDTLFFGGGTPTHLSPKQMERLFSIVLERFSIAGKCEFSIECNPVDITSERVAVMANAGVNRVSLGVQSFDETILRTLERDHTPDIVCRAVEQIRPHIGNISFDLIFGVPGQSLLHWKETLQQALRQQPTHLSTYGLTFEKGTAFWNRREKGELIPVPDDTEHDMYAAAMETLSEAGFEQYEISNFAQPSYACRHNEVYWIGRPCLAFGPGAARFVGGVRETNHRSVTAWMKRVLAGESPVAEVEQLAPEEAARERLVFGMRRIAGVNIDEFKAQTGYRVEQLAAAAIQRHVAGGLLEQTDTHLRLTYEGRFLADTVVVDFL